MKDSHVDLIIKDVDNFLLNEEWYDKYGIPYRRGYLFYGPPGTGKTSMIHTIASTFGMPINYMLFDKNLGSENLIKLMVGAKEKSIIVMEDIDVIFSTENGRQMDSTVVGINFTTLLNVLDGLCTARGIIICMTTNHIERLDPALIRPGRIDVKAELSYCDNEQLTKMFNNYYPSENVSNDYINKILELYDNKLAPALVQQAFILSKNYDSFIEILLSKCEVKDKYTKLF